MTKKTKLQKSVLAAVLEEWEPRPDSVVVSDLNSDNSFRVSFTSDMYYEGERRSYIITSEGDVESGD